MFSQFIDLVAKIEDSLKILKVDLIFSILINVAIVVVLFKITDLFIGKLKSHFEATQASKLSVKMITIFERIIKAIILFVIVASFLQSNGYSVTSFIAGFGITGLAVGFAAQQTVADFFGAIAIMADKMYKLGDYIRIGDVEGYVEDINLLSTKLRTLDDFLVIIPNNSISNSNIINVSRAKKRRINEAFTVTYSTSNEKLKRAIQIIEEVCNENENMYNGATVFTETLDASSINIRLWGYVKTGSLPKFVKIRSDIILEVVKRFREEGIDFAFPSRSVYIEKNED